MSDFATQDEYIVTVNFTHEIHEQFLNDWKWLFNVVLMLPNFMVFIKFRKF